MDNKWFCKTYKKELELFNSIRKQIFLFNKIAGKRPDDNKQMKLVLEEAYELLEAYYKKDKSNFLKELCDLAVTSWFSEEPNLWYNTVLTDNRSNPYKLTYELEDIIDYCCAHKDRDSEAIKDIAGIVVELLLCLDADCISALEAVCKSNMSKFTKYSPANLDKYDQHARDIEAKGRYKKVDWIVSECYVVWKDENNKIMKGYDYQEPDLSKYIL